MARNARKSSRQRTIKPQRSVALPIAGDDETRPAGIRQSRMSRRRAWVLGTIQVLLIAHIVQWLITGRTTTPIEPSESMQFVSDGVINVGLIFFALALLSTLIFGRWMCGWMCHLVLLQDLCGWVMKKCGIRPKPFRSRLLIYVPLLLALYMFIWPAVYRWGVVPLDARLGSDLGESNWIVTSYREMFAIGGIHLPRTNLPAWEPRVELTTDDFWQTFAGVAVAIPFLAICGFGCVYLLGAKGFCTYGCPYGGFFAPLDTLAVGRIRVTDDCEQCGHCTAVCTSNVRVSEEVNTYGMVVDPGCMKCMDCVSVCPNDALYFGFGAPAAGKPRVETPPRRIFDMSWSEEISFAVIFAICFFGTRGVYGAGMIPMLMAAGVAGCATFIFYKAWRLLRDNNVRLHKFQFKRDGCISRSGWIFTMIAVITALLCAHSAVVRSAKGLARYHEAKVRVSPARVFSEHPMTLPADLQEHAWSALGLYRFASSIGNGGIGLLATDQAELDLSRAWMHATLLDFESADDVLVDAIERSGPLPGLCIGRLQVLQTRDHEGLLAFAEDVLTREEELASFLDRLVQWAASEGYERAVMEICKQRLEAFPENLHTMRWLSILQLQVGDYQNAIAVTRRTIEIDPSSPGAYRHLADALLASGQPGQAEDALQAGIVAVDRDQSEQLHRALARLLRALDRPEEARHHLDIANELRSEGE